MQYRKIDFKTKTKVVDYLLISKYNQSISFVNNEINFW